MSNVGFRIYTKINRPSKELLDQFEGVPVANIADEMNRFSCMNAAIKPVNSVPMVGPALTVRARAGDNLMIHKAIQMAQPGDVIVVDAQGDLTNSLTGDLMVRRAVKKGIAGIVIDGAIRDLDTVSTMDIAIYCAGVTPKGPYKNGPGEINVPVTCGGVVVNPGDILVGDGDGIVVITQKDAPVILEKAKAKVKKEYATVKSIEDGTWDGSAYTDEALKKMGCEIIDDVYGK